MANLPEQLVNFSMKSKQYFKMTKNSIYIQKTPGEKQNRIRRHQKRNQPSTPTECSLGCSIENQKWSKDLELATKRLEMPSKLSISNIFSKFQRLSNLPSILLYRLYLLGSGLVRRSFLRAELY